MEWNVECEWLEAFLEQAHVESLKYIDDNVRAAHAGLCNFGRRCPHAREIRQATGELPSCCVALPIYTLQRLEAESLLKGNYYVKKRS